MCLSIPAKIKSIDESNHATVETLGVERQVSLDLINESLNIGDYVLIHVGFAVEKIDTAYALESLKAYEEMAKIMKNDTINKFDGDNGLFGKSD